MSLKEEEKDIKKQIKNPLIWRKKYNCKGFEMEININ